MHITTMRFHSFPNIPNFILCFVVSLVLLSNFHSQNTVFSSADEGDGTSFSYDEETGRGPSRWATLNQSWYLCGNGTGQSPINISNLLVQLRPGLGNLQTDYKPAPATLINGGNDIELYQQIKSLQNGTKEIDLGIVNPADIEYSRPGFWRKYCRYNGSLTAPPCSENVIWTVLKMVQTVSFEQVQALKEAVDDGFEENARPTQPLNGRPVSLYFPRFF